MIVLVGKKRVGKDTIADWLVKNHGYRKVALADKLKEVLSNNSNIPLEAFYEGDRESLDYYEQFVKEVFTKSLIELGLPTEFKIPSQMYSIRTMMQYFGTEVVQNVDKLFWCKQLPVDEKAVISDVRFEHELNYFENLGCTTIFVERDIIDNDTHSSEAGLCHSDNDHVIVNNGSLECLYSRIEQILEVENDRNRT